MRNLITVCLMTCGEETESQCLDRIEPFRGEFIFQEVRNITPAAKALNQMFCQCMTDFLIPLDSDMVLNSDWWERVQIQVEIYRKRSDWHTILFPLFDTLTQEKIYALKVFHMKTMRHIPYPDDPCPDIQHYKDLMAAGLKSVDLYKEDPIGEHVVQGRFYCYAKYRDLYMTARSHPRNTLDSHFKGGRTLREKAKCHHAFFLEQFQNTGNEDYLYCIGGMLEGLTSKLTYRSKDLSNRKMVYADNQSNLFLEWYNNDKSHRVFV